ncbi:MAG: ribonuclease HII [Kiritimatiellae bacterium]|nr:ribonuclease HII [Kiritimatiellia bacterium]
MDSDGETTDLLAFERELWSAEGSVRVAGVDEAGRGCLAGPVVAGAVLMPPDVAERLYRGELAQLTDSKQLTALQRERFFEILTHTPGVDAATGSVSAEEIDRINILAATHLAMRRAVEALSGPPTHVLVDGLPVKGLPVPSTAIVKGDAKSFLIAAASVMAKVTRDHLMIALDARYPGYHFAENKGYGSQSHLAGLYRLGSCPEHRHTFRPVQDVEQRLPGFDFE